LTGKAPFKRQAARPSAFSPGPIARHVGIATRPVRIVADIVERLQLFRQAFDRDLTRKLVDDMADLMAVDTGKVSTGDFVGEFNAFWKALISIY
jgi:hypothetical protein